MKTLSELLHIELNPNISELLEKICLLNQGRIESDLPPMTTWVTSEFGITSKLIPLRILGEGSERLIFSTSEDHSMAQLHSLKHLVNLGIETGKELQKLLEVPSDAPSDRDIPIGLNFKKSLRKFKEANPGILPFDVKADGISDVEVPYFNFNTLLMLKQLHKIHSILKSDSSNQASVEKIEGLQFTASKEGSRLTKSNSTLEVHVDTKKFWTPENFSKLQSMFESIL